MLIRWCKWKRHWHNLALELSILRLNSTCRRVKPVWGLFQSARLACLKLSAPLAIHVKCFQLKFPLSAVAFPCLLAAPLLLLLLLSCVNIAKEANYQLARASIRRELWTSKRSTLKVFECWQKTMAKVDWTPPSLWPASA